jgi:hypothetical protein
VILTLDSLLLDNTDPIKLSYQDFTSSDDDTGSLQDIAGNDVPTTLNFSVQNHIGSHIYYIGANGSDTTGNGTL